MVKSKIACALSVVALCGGSLLPMSSVFADGECQASNLEELEACLAGDATSVTTTGTIVVTGETVDKTLVVNKNIIGASGKDVFHIEDGAKLTLRGNGIIAAGRYGAIADGADLVIDGVRIEAINPASYGVYAKENGRVTIESGQVVADYAAFAGNNTTGDMNFYINGGQLISNRYPAIYMPGQVDLRMRGGTLTGGIVARMGQIVIEGGTINAQPTPVDGDGIDQNYSSMPSVAGEAITLLAGSYKSANVEHGNSMNLTIGDGNVQINGDVVLYDLGNTAEGYEQNVNVRINGGRLTGFKTKFTEEEIGFALKSGYTAGLNNANGRINVAVSGGTYTTEPDAADIAEGDEADYIEEEGVYRIFPKEVNYREWGAINDFGTEEGHVPGWIEFGKDFNDDRKAIFSIVEKDDLSGLKIDESKGAVELYGAVDLNLLKRDGNTVIPVGDSELTVSIVISEEDYEKLSQYDRVEVIYFDENGEESGERLEAKLDSFMWIEDGVEHYVYLLEFSTTHLSTYGIVGVNETEEEPEEETVVETESPDTGTVTAAGASASIAAMAAAVTVGMLTSIVSFTYLMRRRG